ncbi:SusC/RagA family TonB-linked outer membrane protein [Chitinophaga vietnamensis]|uniref:SusC/RagA family TonB-linked outer membrane protein n=1 Tax=Chitinophaga vietnamensis TaxID=2593957 RepID=UPI0013762F24|nr:TonB-dependent receptor [Chitinophaga vietnamensis]
MRKVVFLLLSVFLLAGQAFAQSRTVTGKVTDGKDGSPIPGVTIQVKGTSKGTTTTPDGFYKINVDDNNAVLVFSFVGYANKEVPANQSVINVGLSTDNRELSEVVVTGYTQVDRKKVVSSIAEVSSKQIENVPMPDVNQILQGRAPGVVSASSSGQPGSMQKITIRGIGSLSASASPLYVIDGVIINNGQFNYDVQTQSSDIMANLNPNDIESVSVLKDASALALYGARGSNGVIVITTKKGKAGTSKVNVKAQYGFNSPSFGKWKQMNAQQAFDYQKKVFALNGYTPDQVAEQMPDSLLKYAFDWRDAAFQNGHTQNYEISSSGGNDKTKYYISGGYFSQDGALIYSGFKRYSVLSNVSQKVNDRLDIGMNLNLSYSDANNAGAGNRYSSPLLASFANSPLLPAYQPNGKLYTGLEDYWQNNSSTGDNFLYSVPRNANNNYNFRGLGKLYLNYRIFDWLKFNQSVSADMIMARQKTYQDPTTGDGFNAKTPANSGDIYEASQNNRTITSQTSFSGNFNLGEKNQFDYLALMEYAPTHFVGFSAEGIGIANGKLRAMDNASTPQAVKGSEYDYRFLSYLGQLNYTYNSKYYLTTSIRRDGSSRFGANRKYATFYAVGASWRIIDEEFMKSQHVFSDLKLRASYGTSGNANFGNYEAMALYKFDVAYNGDPASRFFSLGNPNLTWEKSNNANIGVDMGFLDNRITASVDFYNKKSTGLLMYVPIPPSVGLKSRPDNVGAMQNRGIEATVSTVNIKTREFTWGSDITFGLNKNKVLELPNHDPINNFTDFDQNQYTNTILKEGLPAYTWYLKEWAGVDPNNGDPLWYTADGKTTNNYDKAAFKTFGSTMPKYTLGFNNTFTYKGITLSAFFYASQGNQIFNGTKRFGDADGGRFGWNYNVEAGQNYWTTPGQHADRPKPVIGGNQKSNAASSRYLEDGSYIRLRNVTLGYNLPQNVLKAAKIQGVRVYVQGQNLLTITNYSGVDPEIGYDGFEFFKYPVSKSVSFGIDITL